ncbi:beta-lactamase superfamily domain-containing protein [Choanephora cucurbitarum]|nr:beta-lactamase superfamily domain-containing protein [Choanephora cucurbitarum]
MMRRSMSTLASCSMFVSLTPKIYAEGKRPHHDGNRFRNPWPSFVPFTVSKVAKTIWSMDLSGTEKKIRPVDLPEKLDIQWDRPQKDNQITATWLGHACVLVQLKGFTVLFDPIFSQRCSPVQFMGPKRYTQTPCLMEQLPPIDIVVISHNHYDHMDQNTLYQLDQLNPNCKFCVPLGNKKLLNLAKPLDESGNERVMELDWWDSVVLKKEEEEKEELKLTCTPSQHQSGRGLFDKDIALWSSWSIEGSNGKVFFAGDTGYRSVPDSATSEEEKDYKYLDTLPHCPAFKEIGDKLGPFDLALIPIGAYSPRWFMSTFHCSPEDAVDLHRDVKSKKSMAIHWGTFVLTDEPVEEPPQRLIAALAERGLDKHEFTVVPLGGTMTATSE